jgi:hypothetical protein
MLHYEQLVTLKITSIKRKNFVVFYFLKIDNYVKVHLREYITQLNEAEIALLVQLKQELGPQLLDYHNALITNGNLKIIVIQKKKLVVFFLRN